MALTDRDIIITPNRGAAVEPKIAFIGADSVSSGTITLKVLNSGTTGILSFEGNSGQLLSIADTMSGTIFSANDISGIPSIEVLDTGMVKLAQYNGTVVIGTGTNSTGKLQIYGNTWSNSAGGDLVVRNSSSVGSAITMMPVNSASFSAGWSLYAGASGAAIGDGAVGLWNHTASAARLYVNQAGNLTVTGSVSGTQFYDSTNSAFYLFPTGNSRLRGISSLGSELASGHDPYGLISVTRGTGSDYAYFGLTRSGVVGMGIGIDSNNYLWFGGTTGGHNGTKNSTYFYTDTSGNVVANTSFQAPIFRDSSDPTNYYVDPAGTSRIRKTNLIASGSAWDDGLNLYSSDATNRWNLLVDDGAADSFRIAYNNSEALNINTSRNVTAAVDFRAPIFYDSDNTAYYFNGAGTTNLLNLTVNGTLTVSSFGSNQINLGAQRQYYVGNLGAAATQAKRYEVARLFVDIANWHDSGVMLVELQSQYYAGGDYQLWSVNYDYGGATGNPTCRLIKGDSPRGRNAQVTIGTPVQISGNFYYVSVYVEVKYYSSYYTFVKTTQTANSSATAANSGAAWVFTSPAAGTNIADFTPSTTVTTNNTLQSTADMRAPIFYDNDNTGYYVDPNSTTNLNEVQFQNGKWYTSNNGSGNSTDMYIRPNGDNTYVWRMIFGGSSTGYGTGAGGFGIYNNTLAGDYSAIFPSGGFAVFPYSVRSPIYYDYTDTTYFVDPNSNSYINFLRSAGNMQANGGAIAIPTSYKNVPGVTPGTTGDWKRGSSSLIMAGSQNTDGSGWSYGSRLVNVDYGDGLGMSVDVNYANGWTNDALFVSGRSGRIGNVGINQTLPAEKLDVIGRLKVTSVNNNGYGWIYSTDTNHSIIMRGDRDGTANNFTNYYQYGGTHANALGHRFWTGGALASQTEKFRISDNVTASFQQIYAPSLYDINDTGYYLDPNGTSNLFRGYFSQLMRRNTRFANGDRYPVGHYSDGDMVWNIDPSWSEYELQEYFGSSAVTWVADSTAPGGYAIQVAGGVNVFTNGSGAGFPMIPIDSADDVFYMEIWIKGISGTANHYMGSVDFNENFASLGGNPGSYGYWVLVGNVPGTSWSKWYGYIGGFGSDYGTFKPGAKYWSPQALFNYSGGTSYISGWKVLRVNRQTSMIINTPNGSSSTGASSSRGQTLTIKRSNTAQLNLGSYPGAWTSAIQIQNNDANAWLWMSPLTGYTPTIATNYGAINYYTTAQNAGFAGSMNNGSFRSPLFYDSDNTAYYLDPNADLSLRVYGEISNSNYAEGNLQPGALNIGRTDTNYSWGGSWNSNVLTGILANCLNNWEFAIHDSGERVVSPFAFFGGGSYYLEMGRDIGWGTMPIYATNSFRAPIFYDSNDTSYYVDPHSTSYIRSLFLGAHDSGAAEFRFGEDSSGWYGDRWYWDSGYNVYRYSRFAGSDTLIHYHDTRDGSRITYGRNIVFDDYGKGIVGNYDSTRLQAVFAMGDSYKLAVNGTSAGNLYGLAWSHPNAGGIGGANNLNDHGLLIINNGGFRAAISSRAVFSADVRGTLFYDYNDTGYYVDPNADRSSNINGFSTRTQAMLGLTAKYSYFRPVITGDTNYWVGSMGWGSYNFGSDIFHWGSGFIDSWGSTGAEDRPGDTSHHVGVQALHYTTGSSSAYGWQMIGGVTDSLWWRHRWGGSYSQWFKVAMYGNNANTGAFYASIYYDSDNTSYYVDPTSTSILSTLRLPGATSGYSLMVGENNTTGVYNENTRYGVVINAPYYPHLYLTATTDNSNTTHGPVISMQGRLSAGGYRKWNIGIPNRNPNELSIGWADNNDNPHYGVGINWGAPASMWIDTGHNLYARGSMRAPIFYDYDNTGFYLNPNGTSNLSVMIAYSYQGNGNVGGTGSATWHPSGIYSAGYNWLYGGGNAGGGSWTNFSSVYATIYYDYNDSGYYADPNSTSNMYKVTAYQGARYQSTDWADAFRNTPTSSRTFHGDVSAGGPAGTWWFYDSMRHGNGSNYWGTQIAYGWEDNANEIRQRNVTGNSFSGWVRYLNSSNYSGFSSFSGAVYGTIYYDANNTGYYADPDNTSVFYRLNINNNVYFTNYGRGMVGSYASTRYQAVFAMGDSYKLPDDGNGVGNLYGIAWSYPSAGGAAGNLASHGMLILENGTFKGAWGGGSLRTPGDVRGTIFYDYDNTGYYADLNATNSINVYGRIYAGAGVRGGTYGAINSSGFNTNVVGSASASYTGGGCGHPPWGGSPSFGGFINVNGGGLGAVWSGNGATYYGGEPGSVFYGGNGDYTSGGGAGIFAVGGEGGYYAMAGAGIYARGGTNGYWFGVSAYGITRAPAAYFDGNVYIMTPSGSTQCGLNIGYFEYTSNSNSTYVLRANGPGYFSSYVDATQFRDSNNTGYYVDPSSNSFISSLQVQGDITVGQNQGSSNIYMYDSDEGTRRIHCNSNRVGFLNDSNGWGSYCGDGGEWYSDQSVRSPIFYDNNNTAYYCDPNGYSQFSSGEFNNYARVSRLEFIGVGGNSGVGNQGYAIYQEGGGWGNPYPDLAIAYHTGIKIGAYFGYNGTRIYNNNDMATQIASFGDGDNNFRSYYNIIAYASDERLKENIVNIPNALEKLQQLNGVTFDWKAMVTDLGFEPQAWHEVGVLAQQVQAVLPEAVEIAPFDYDWEKPGQSISGEKYLTVKYEKIVPLLIEAVKDQQKIINDQEARISRLESLIEKFNL